ncbi:hypothetical protein [Desulfosoma caldarium]|uniref:Uncharacterized protein n=1 Tax=Desulfosoma caldarium TaxID=610254 RepID=A0A3N1VKV7_9BACT|nr:hypothetical protein [Desulfosoma caldarium]ROR01571.1 hypothetical protein EDC27_0750 [Desulfosoma caldarium]
MTHSAPSALEELVSLAKDYDAKRRQLDDLAHDLAFDLLLRHLLVFSERATDRFRAAQQVLFDHLSKTEVDPEAMEAARTLCRCFDEILLLFHKLADHTSGVTS